MATSPRMTRYVLRELVMPTLLGLLLYTFVLMMNHFFLVAEKALTKNLGAELTLRLFMVGLPKILLFSIPMAVLLGTLIGLGRLSADSEWVALQSSGQGPGAILKPVLLHGLFGTIATFMIYAVVIPETHYATRNLSTEVIFSSNLAADLRPRVFYELPDDTLLYVDDIRAGGTQRLDNVILARPDPQNRGRTQLVLARYGDLYPAPDGSGDLIVDLFEGEFHGFQADTPDQYDFITFESNWGYRLEAPRFLKTLMTPPHKVAQDLTMGELSDEIDEARVEHERVKQQAQAVRGGRLLVTERRLAAAEMELQRRFALPLASLCFALLAIPLGIATARSGKGAGFALSVVVIVVYRLVFVTASGQALNGRIPATLGPWVANFVILLWAAIAFWRMRHSLRRSGGALATPFRWWRKLRHDRASRGEREADAERTATELVALGGTSRRFAGRLDRYIGLAYLRTFGLALFSTYLIYAVVEGQELADRAVRTHQSVGLVFHYLTYFAPGVLHVVLPISCLIGAIVSITLLARTSELVAVKAAGVSLRRATLPILLLTLGMSGALFLVQDRIAPAANRKAQEIEDGIRKRAPRTHGLPKTGSWRFGTAGTELYHFRLHDPQAASYQHLSVFTIDRSGPRPRIVEHRHADTAHFVDCSWEFDRSWSPTFIARDGSATPPNAFQTVAPLVEYDEPIRVELDLPRDLMDERRWLMRHAEELPDQVSLGELSDKIDALRTSGNDQSAPRPLRQ